VQVGAGGSVVESAGAADESIAGGMGGSAPAGAAGAAGAASTFCFEPGIDAGGAVSDEVTVPDFDKHFAADCYCEGGYSLCLSPDSDICIDGLPCPLTLADLSHGLGCHGSEGMLSSCAGGETIVSWHHIDLTFDRNGKLLGGDFPVLPPLDSKVMRIDGVVCSGAYAASFGTGANFTGCTSCDTGADGTCGVRPDGTVFVPGAAGAGG